MNNIEILENIIQCFKQLQNTLDDNEKELFEDGIQQKEIQAIENLIQENKELKEENIKYEALIDYLQTLNHKYYEDNVTLLRKNGKVGILADNIHFKYIDTVENYIPKSKIKKRIEELQQTCKDCHFRGSICKNFKTFNQCTVQVTIKNLQELLEGE